jgi:aryl-alcohol dehydrogenase-like predicted oxidoreductase
LTSVTAQWVCPELQRAREYWIRRMAAALGRCVGHRRELRQVFLVVIAGVSSLFNALQYSVELARSPAVLPIRGTSWRAHLEDNVAAVTLHLTAAELQQLR